MRSLGRVVVAALSLCRVVVAALSLCRVVAAALALFLAALALRQRAPLGVAELHRRQHRRLFFAPLCFFRLCVSIADRLAIGTVLHVLVCVFKSEHVKSVAQF